MTIPNSWRSLRGRITILAVVTCLLLAAAALVLYLSVRGSRAATENAARRHLVQLASSLARSYSEQAVRGTSLREAESQQVNSHSEPKPVVPALLDAPVPPPPPPPPQPLRPDGLSALTRAALGSEEDVQGGFLAASGTVVGYAASQQNGPPQPPPLPPRERALIEQLGAEAMRSGTPKTGTLQGLHEVVLVATQALTEGNGSQQHMAGVAFVLGHIPNGSRQQSLLLLLAGAGFGAAALITSLLAWLVVSEVQGGVTAVTQRLSTVHSNLEASGPKVRTPLAEFEHVLDGINVMAAALRTRIANERSLEEELRHKERLSSLGQFAAGVAHELRNPLATIRLRAQMSQNASTNSSTERNSGVILEEVDRLDAMISRLLQFARPLALEQQKIDLCELCHEVQQAWSERTEAELTLTCHIEDGGTIRGDRSRLQQVLDNLVENAIQASKPGNPIVIELRSAPEAVTLSVLDRGTGLEPAALTHAMDPFFTTKASGTGLGLSIAFEIVQAHNGELTILPRPGGGTVASVTLPRATSRTERKA